MAALSKLKAFTLMEVMVAMAISGIVLATAMSAFGIMERQFDNFRERGGDIFQVQRTRSLLAKDISDAVLVQNAGSSIVLRMPDDNVLQYHFRAGALTREREGREDTIALGVSLPDMAAVPGMGASAPVGHISFTMEVKGKIYPLVFYKIYSPAALINLE